MCVYVLYLPQKLQKLIFTSSGHLIVQHSPGLGVGGGGGAWGEKWGRVRQLIQHTVDLFRKM